MTVGCWGAVGEVTSTIKKVTSSRNDRWLLVGDIVSIGGGRGERQGKSRSLGLRASGGSALPEVTAFRNGRGLLGRACRAWDFRRRFLGGCRRLGARGVRSGRRVRESAGAFRAGPGGESRRWSQWRALEMRL